MQSCDAKLSEHEQLKQHIDAQADMLMHPNTIQAVPLRVDKYLHQQGVTMSRQLLHEVRDVLKAADAIEAAVWTEKTAFPDASLVRAAPSVADPEAVSVFSAVCLSATSLKF